MGTVQKQITITITDTTDDPELHFDLNGNGASKLRLFKFFRDPAGGPGVFAELDYEDALLVLSLSGISKATGAKFLKDCLAALQAKALAP